MSYKSHVPGSSRYFDHLYDPLYVTSGVRNVWKANRMSLQKASPVMILPIFKTMFTELTTQARNYYVLHQTPLPFPSFYKRYTPVTQVQNPHMHVRGTCRANFYTHSKKCKKGAKPQLMPPPNFTYPECSCDYDQPKTRDVECQTMYRESSAQTKPWMPDAVIGEGVKETPEIVEVAQLILGDNYPGLIEVEIIERARRKREWEAHLNKHHKPEEDWEKKKQTLEVIEWEELMAQEADIHNCQMQRLRIVSALMHKREKEIQLNAQAKVENTRKRIERRAAEEKKKLEAKHKSDLRKLELKFKGSTRRNGKRSVLEEHINYGSDLYAPVLINGETGKSRNYVDLKSNYEPKFINFKDIEIKQEQASEILNNKVQLWEPKRQNKELQKGFWNEHFLRKLYHSLKFLRMQAEFVPKGPPKCLVFLSTPVQSAVTTPTEFVHMEDEMQYQQAVMIQKIVKGRCIQKLIHQNRTQLIGEIQSTHQLSTVEKLFPEQKAIMEQWKSEMLMLQDEQELLFNEHKMREILDQPECQEAAQIIEFLGLELKRLQEQKKGHALYMLAEQERYKREAAEIGQTQLNEKLQRECEEVHRSILKDNYDTATMYLENILVDGIDKIAEEDSRIYIKKIAQRIDNEATIAVKTATQAEKKETALGLLNTFVIPEVYKTLAEEDYKSKQQARLKAANEAIYSTIDEVIPIPTESEILVRTLVDPIVKRTIKTPPLPSVESLTNEEFKVTNTIINEMIDYVFAKRHSNIIDPIVEGILDDVMDRVGGSYL